MESQEFVIECDQVSKRYDRHALTLRHSLARLFRCHQKMAHDGEPEFWAIRDLSFAVRRGEVLGIIGPNGAGKSTTLKLIAGISRPTSGRISVKGRVGTLIELGAGFSPDLTGRENIYLNAGVLGLTRREIQQRIGDIEVFSGLREFLDVPVKYYSSGMYAKLGFSVAVHLEADILLTDEILAVGDAVFQRQCVKKFQEIKDSTTILFVSHDMAKVKQICSRVIWIKEGRVRSDGDPDKVIEAYLESLQQERERVLQGERPLGPTPGAERCMGGEIEIVEVTTHDGEGGPRSVFRTFEDLVIRIHYRVRGPFSDPGFGVRLYSSDGLWVHGTNTFIDGVPIHLVTPEGYVELRYSKMALLEGEYWISAGVAPANNWLAPYDSRERVQRFEVIRSQSDGGMFGLPHEWVAESRHEKAETMKES